MRNSIISNAVSGLFAQVARQGADQAGDYTDPADARQRLQAAATAPKVLNAEAIKVFFGGEGAAKAAGDHAKADVSRMAWLVSFMFVKDGEGYKPAVDNTTVNNAVKEYVADVRKALEYKPGKKGQPSTVHGKPISGRPAEIKTAQNRASSVRVLYGAMRLFGFNPVGKLGWEQATTEAVKMLQERNVDWMGIKAPTAEQKATAKIAASEKSVAQSFVDAAAAKAAELGRSLTTEERAGLVAESEAIHAAQTVSELCAGILAKYGTSIGEQIAAYMPQAILDFEATKEQQPQAQ